MRILPLAPSAVSWLPWGAEAFARARAEQKPVLLCISAAWSDSCREMDRTSYADREVISLIQDRFVPVRVDADYRPDVSDRYNLGGWPTTAFLTPDGEILGGGTFIAQERMAGVLERAAGAFSSQGAVIALRSTAYRPTRDADARVAADPAAIDDLSDRVFAAFDDEHGGFGSAPKFPFAAPVHLALELNTAHSSARLETMAVRTLDAMGWGGLYDEIDGGFFRCAATRDWQQPDRAKLLDVNAELLTLYLSAGAALGAARFSERAADVLRYVQNWLADPVDGGWHGSQAASAFYCDSNARMVSAALAASTAFEDTALLEFALKSLERVGLACYAPGRGVAHWYDPSTGSGSSRAKSRADGSAAVRGLLADQIATAAAHLDAFDATGNIVYEMMAEELAHYAIRTMWDDQGDGFFDAADDPSAAPVGLLRIKHKPFVTNCDAVRLLTRLSTTSGEHEFAQRAKAALAAVAPLVREQGPLAAHYVLASRDVMAR